MIFLAMAIASTTITISQTLIFKPLRERLPGKWLKKLFKCPYCLAHYFSFFAVFFILPWYNYLDLIIKTMALVALSSIFGLLILYYLNLLESSTVTITRNDTQPFEKKN